MPVAAIRRCDCVVDEFPKVGAKTGLSFVGVPTYIEDVNMHHVLGSLDEVIGDFFEVFATVKFSLPSRGSN